MDRISALRNVEAALARFEDGELSLPELEGEVRGTLRTYATDFSERTAYRASGPAAVDGLVVLADSPAGAREQLAAIATEAAVADAEFEPIG